MEIRLLSDEYLKSSALYIDFLEDKVGKTEDQFDNKSVYVNNPVDFPIYMNVSEGDRKKLFMEAFFAIGTNYLEVDREYLIDGQFWYSLFLLKKRSFLIENYPSILNDDVSFKNIVLKKFDWENYVYKCVLASQYVFDTTDNPQDRTKYFEAIIDNLDLYNYIIKYSIFRNQEFLINVMDIVMDNTLSEILKAKIKDRPDLGNDERYGRRVIYELNKCYPIILAPTLKREDLEVLFLESLRKYTDHSSTSINDAEGNRSNNGNKFIKRLFGNFG